MRLQVKRTMPNAVLPKKSRTQDAAFDLTAASMLVENGYIEYDTGVAVKIPEGHVGLLFPRSSVSNQDLIMANSVGVIDENYTGNLKLRFRFMFNKLKEAKIYVPGDRVGQLIVIPIPSFEIEEVEELPETERGEAGFGSSGN